MTELVINLLIIYVLGFIGYLVSELRWSEQEMTIISVYLNVLEAVFWPITLVLRLLFEN